MPLIWVSPGFLYGGLRLGESQPGDLQGQLSAALAYIRALEANREVPSEPGSLKRANRIPVPRIDTLCPFLDVFPDSLFLVRTR